MLLWRQEHPADFSSPVVPGPPRGAPESPGKDSNALSCTQSPFTRRLSAYVWPLPHHPLWAGRQQLSTFQMLLMATREEVRGR